MNNVFRHIMVAEADVNFGTLDLVGAVAARRGGAFQRTDIRTRLRFGEIHRSGPLAG